MLHTNRERKTYISIIIECAVSHISIVHTFVYVCIIYAHMVRLIGITQPHRHAAIYAALAHANVYLSAHMARFLHAVR